MKRAAGSMVFRLMLLVYLLSIGYFAFRPFHRIPGLSKGSPSKGFEDGNGARVVRNALTTSEKLSLAAVIRPSQIRGNYSSTILSYSRDAFNRNFELDQYQDGILFRLSSTPKDRHTQVALLMAPGVFEGDEPRHVVITYDGVWISIFVDGKIRAQGRAPFEGLEGWGYNHLLTVGDIPPGGREWHGTVESFFIFDRALNDPEIKSLASGHDPVDEIYRYRREDKQGSGMKRLRYRNLLLYRDRAFQLRDCVANIVGFIPLAFLIYFSCSVPSRIRLPAILLFPVLFGFLISLSIEFTQRMLVGRVPTLLDLVYNLLGAIVGTLLLWGFIIIKSQVFKNSMRRRT